MKAGNAIEISVQGYQGFELVAIHACEDERIIEIEWVDGHQPSGLFHFRKRASDDLQCGNAVEEDDKFLQLFGILQLTLDLQ